MVLSLFSEIHSHGEAAAEIIITYINKKTNASPIGKKFGLFASGTNDNNGFAFLKNLSLNRVKK